MINNSGACENAPDVPCEILSSPALLFLFYRIEQIMGIKAGSDALKMLNEYLEKSCGASFIENPAAYEHLLASREQIYTISKFITVNETYFFRESLHFDLLTTMLPQLIQHKRPLHVCCAAVSIGCEAYSIAMLLEHHVVKGLDFDYTVDAFDINAHAIETAKNARYTSNTIRNDGSSYKHILDSYLNKENDEYTVKQSIRRKVRFFSHNIMRGLGKQYDIIFFRNSLIYFSSKNRLSVLHNLSDSLHTDGLLFLGVSETSSVKHPLLVSRCSSEVFYFQKIGHANLLDYFDYKTEKQHSDKKNKDKQKTQVLPKQEEIPVNCAEIAEILKTLEGKTNAQDVIGKLENGDINSITGSQLAASAVYFLNIQEFENVNIILTFLEGHSSCAFTRFLRGEYFYHRGFLEDAEKFYHEASVKDKYFWPAFYRIAVVAADGNPTRHEYKIKKTIESIEHWQGLNPENRLNYECFLGGFSPDYFRRILEKKLT